MGWARLAAPAREARMLAIVNFVTTYPHVTLILMAFLLVMGWAIRKTSKDF